MAFQKPKSKNGKFIGAFVNEMYSILIGIGIGNVIFKSDILGYGKDFNLDMLLNIGMLFFVIFVILLYWWDWNEYIEDEILKTSSRRELVLDFMILVNLEFLFNYFNEPSNLALTFLFLGILDLCWVLNNILESNLNSKNIEATDSNAKNKAWILEKVIGVAIYFLSLIIVNQINYFSFANTYKELLQGGIIILTFIIVRHFSFNQVYRTKRLYFEKATMEDSKVIVNINKSYFNNKKENFLINQYDSFEIENIIKKDNKEIYVAKNLLDEILGYVVISSQIDDKIFKKVEFIDDLDSTLKSEFNFGNYIYIDQVAVRKDNLREGVASFIYNSLLRRFKQSLFLSFVVKSPKNNKTSREFHKALGFEKVGKFEADKFAGLENYKSILFCKNGD